MAIVKETISEKFKREIGLQASKQFFEKIKSFFVNSSENSPGMAQLGSNSVFPEAE